MDIKKIYFDMDGVLADFDRGVIELCGLEPLSQGISGPKEELMWGRIRDVGHFYDKLEIMPGAKEMFDIIYEKYGDVCEILPGIPKPKRGVTGADEDKIKWVRRLLSKDIKINVVLRENKPKYCTGKDCILIDDYKTNIREWEAAGGTGILNTSAKDTLIILQEMGIL
ncbi:MAG: hypothetical protein K6E85_06055 [Lachnospiraceae bacterium]|nr:hypothetical protein [Lachnospiraceae bacterium]